MYGGTLFEALAYVVYIREVLFFSLACASNKAIKFHEVKVDVQKGPRGLAKKMTMDVLVSSIVIIYS